MKSFHYLNLGKPKIKSIEISTQDFLGIDKGVYNPHDITLYINLFTCYGPIINSLHISFYVRPIKIFIYSCKTFKVLIIPKCPINLPP
jgi:hypothetical protein